MKRKKQITDTIQRVILAIALACLLGLSACAGWRSRKPVRRELTASTADSERYFELESESWKFEE